MRKKVAVVVLNWNGSTLIPHYLPPLLEHTDPELADVVEADNGSADDSLEILARDYPQAVALPLGATSASPQGTIGPSPSWRGMTTSASSMMTSL